MRLLLVVLLLDLTLGLQEVETQEASTVLCIQILLLLHDQMIKVYSVAAHGYIVVSAERFQVVHTVATVDDLS